MKASILGSVLVVLCSILSAQNGYYPVNRGMKWGMVNNKGELKIPFKYKLVDPRHFGGIVPFTLIQSEKGYGVFNPEKGEVLAPVFQSITFTNPTFFEGFFVGVKEGKKGIYDLEGKLVFTTEYPFCKRIGENSWAVGDGSKMGIWKNGMQEVATLPYQNVSPLNETLRIITEDSSRYLVKIDGTRCKEQAYQRIERVNKSWFVGTHDRGDDIFDKEGELVLSFQDTFVHELSAAHISYKTDISGGLSLRYGLMDWQKKIITPPDYTEYNFDSSGFLWVKQNNLWGVIDDSSKIVYVRFLQHPRKGDNPFRTHKSQ